MSGATLEYLIVPGSVSRDGADFWIGAVARAAPHDAELTVGPVKYPLGGVWKTWRTDHDRYHIAYARVRASGLAPGRRYEVTLSVEGEERARANVRTLPARLPVLGEKPFTAFLGSCFSPASDSVGAVGSSFASLPSGAAPDVKFLCGDQVYLDAPWPYFLTHTHDRSGLARRFYLAYLRTWLQAGSGSGFSRLLSHGANFFTSDDHDFWNNAPNAAIYARDTWSDPGRDTWWKLASDLYSVFQTPNSRHDFQVGNLGFFVVDTRRNRDSDRKRFMAAADLAALGEWIQRLKGPGIIVLGQNLFAEKAGWWGLAGHVGDWTSPTTTNTPNWCGISSAPSTPWSCCPVTCTMAGSQVACSGPA